MMAPSVLARRSLPRSRALFRGRLLPGAARVPTGSSLHAHLSRHWLSWRSCIRLPGERRMSGAAGQAAPDVEVCSTENVYETDELVNQYLGLHYQSSGCAEGVPAMIAHDAAPQHALHFPQRVAKLLVSLQPARTNGRALDVGCAVGGSSFELAASGFDEVVGFDFSKAFVDMANRMKQGESIRFRVPIEADLSEEVIATHEPNIDAEVRSRVSFHVGDACTLREDAATLGTFDGVIMANLLCRLPEPMVCLDGLGDMVNPGGVVVLVTPWSWLEQFTNRDKWLGGYRNVETGSPVHSKDVLRSEMERRGFVKVYEEQMPLVIREHQRKYQYIVSEATAWRKQPVTE